MRVSLHFTAIYVHRILVIFLSLLYLRCPQACTISIRDPLHYARIATEESELMVEVQLHHPVSLSGSSTFLVATVHHRSRCFDQCTMSRSPSRTNPRLFFSLSRFVNIGQTIMYEDTETSLLESESIFVSVSVDLQSFVGLQTISVHVIGTFTPKLPTSHPFLLPLLHFISWPTHTTPIRCSAQFWSCALVLLVCAGRS